MKGLSATQWACLEVVRRAGGPTSARYVAAATNQPIEGVGRTLASLVRRGLIAKHDGRPPTCGPKGIDA